ncbi:DUF7427 family protein [Bradyrhizobium sp.]
MRRYRPSPGAAGWIAVGVAVAIAEITDSRPMTEAFREAIEDPVLGPAICVGYGYLTAHLFGVLPPKYDLIHLFYVHTIAKRKARHA